MAQEASYVGKRVEWIGPPQTGYVTAAYRAAIDAGEVRPPTREEQRDLAPGEHGTITELVGVDETGCTVAVQFDRGYQLNVVLPAPTLVRFIKHSAGPSATGPRRYVSARRRTPLGQLLHGLLRAVRLTADAR